MALQRAGSEELTGGEMTSKAGHLIGLNEAILAENIDPRDTRGAATRNGRTQFSTDNGSNAGVKGIKAWTRDTGTSFLVYRTGTTFWHASTAGVASIGIGGTSDARFGAALLNDLMCLVVDGLAPKKWDGTTFSSLAGTPPSEAKFAAMYASKVFLAGDDANPQKLSFCATNNPDDWTAVNDAGSITTQDGGGDTIQGLSAARKWLCIFYRNFVDILIGNSVFNYSVERLINQGLTSQTGHATAGDVVFFASDIAIYMVAGARASDITTGKMHKTYQDIADKSKITMAVKGDLLLVVDYGAGRAYACYYKLLRWAEWTGQAWETMDTSVDQTLYAGTDNSSTTQVWKLDTGSLDGSTAITGKWRTPNLSFGWPDCPKVIAAVRALVKPGMGTLTLTYYKNGTALASTTTIDAASIAASGDVDWIGRAGNRGLRGAYLGVTFQWTGAYTLYGYAFYAEVTADPGELPVEI